MTNLIVPAPTSLPEDQTTISNSKPSSLCEECGSNAWKYRCPGCEIKSCSLSCVNSHKARTSCTGKRNRTEFVPLSKFDDNLLLSDYNFLEETKRVTESAHRLFSSIDRFQYFGFKLPKRIFMLRNAAHNRRIKLLLQHPAMSKRKLNRSRYDYKKGSIFWTVEWKFHATDISFVNHFVGENTSLVSVIKKHLAPTPFRDNLTPFRNADMSELKFFIRITPKGPTSPFRELDINAPLHEQLSDVEILEYPLIFVFLPSHSVDFEVEKHSKPAFRKPEVPTIDSQPSPKGKLYEEEEIEEGEILPDEVENDLMATDLMAPANIATDLMAPANIQVPTIDSQPSPKGKLYEEEEIEEGEILPDAVENDLMAPANIATDLMAPANIQVNDEAENDTVISNEVGEAKNDTVISNEVGEAENDTVISNEVGECSRPSSDASSVQAALREVNFGELLEAYSEILGGMNPDDFWCFDDDFGGLCNMGDIFGDDALEEGELLDFEDIS